MQVTRVSVYQVARIMDIPACQRRAVKCPPPLFRHSGLDIFGKNDEFHNSMLSRVPPLPDVCGMAFRNAEKATDEVTMRGQCSFGNWCQAKEDRCETYNL